MQLLHDQHAVQRAHQHQVLLASGGVLTQGRAAGGLQRLAQQPVRPIATLVGPR